MALDVGTCEHPDQPHTVWYWVEDGGPPVPNSATFDNLADALRYAEPGSRSASAYLLRWIKVFRSDNEAYTCWRWENDVPYEPTPRLSGIDVPRESLVEPRRRRWWQRFVR